MPGRELPVPSQGHHAEAVMITLLASFAFTFASGALLLLAGVSLVKGAGWLARRRG